MYRKALTSDSLSTHGFFGRKTSHHPSISGGNMLVPSSRSNVYDPSYLLDGRPPATGPYLPAEAFPELSMWHSQDGVTGTLPHQQLKERLELATGGRPLEFEVPRNAFHLPPLRELDSGSKPIGTNSPTTGWCGCSRGLEVLFYGVRSRRTHLLRDQLWRADAGSWQIADRSDLRTARPEVTSVGDFRVRLAVEL